MNALSYRAVMPDTVRTEVTSCQRALPAKLQFNAPQTKKTTAFAVVLIFIQQGRSRICMQPFWISTLSVAFRSRFDSKIQAPMKPLRICSSLKPFS